MDTASADALLIRSDDGRLYAIPRDLLERCRVQNSESDEVRGYLNPQPLPPRVAGQHYQTFGWAPYSLTGGLNQGLPDGNIIIVGGRVAF